MLKKNYIAFSLLLLFFIALSILHNYPYKDLIPKGIYFGNMDLGGLTKEEAKAKIEKSVEDELKREIALEINDKKWTFKLSDLIKIDIDQCMNNIFRYIENKNVFNKYILRYKLKSTPIHVLPEIVFNEDKSSQLFNEIDIAIQSKPKDAYFKIIGDEVSIETEKIGKKLDVNKLMDSIKNILWTDKKNIAIPTKPWHANITEQDLLNMDIEKKLAEYSTKFDKSLKGRTQNIKLAAEKIDGYILAPNDIFSFNKAVGERTSQKGYKQAPVFIDNKIVMDVGGGICQVSSTLYNVALMSDLDIIERTNHSLPVSYVPLGRDATVNYGTIDLKFKNNTGRYILISAQVVEDTLTIKFFSSKEMLSDVELISETVEVINSPITIKKDSSLNEGEIRMQKGSPGYIVKLWKKYINGDDEKSILVSTDVYNPTPTFMYVGEKEMNADKQIQSETTI